MSDFSGNGNVVDGRRFEDDTSRLDVTLSDLLMRPSLGARTLEVMSGRVLFEPESPATDLFFIQSGQVRLYQIGPDGSTRLVEILGQGDWCGVAALAGEPTYGMRAAAVTAAAVVQAPVKAWMTLLGEHPTLAAQWIGKLAAKLQAARADAACLVFDDCNSRLIRTLLHFSRTAAASPLEEGEIVLRITHQQLAQAVGAARETVSLALTQLRQRNLLRTGRNQLFFNPQALEKFCNRTGNDDATPVERDEQVA